MSTTQHRGDRLLSTEHSPSQGHTPRDAPHDTHKPVPAFSFADAPEHTKQGQLKKGGARHVSAPESAAGPAQAVWVLPRAHGAVLGFAPVSLDLAKIESNFHMRLPDAAKCLGISVTTLKHVCRKLGIARWPRCLPRSAQSKDARGASAHAGAAPALAVQDSQQPCSSRMPDCAQRANQAKRPRGTQLHNPAGAMMHRDGGSNDSSSDAGGEADPQQRAQLHNLAQSVAYEAARQRAEMQEQQQLQLECHQLKQLHAEQQRNLQHQQLLEQQTMRDQQHHEWKQDFYNPYAGPTATRGWAQNNGDVMPSLPSPSISPSFDSLVQHSAAQKIKMPETLAQPHTMLRAPPITTPALASPTFPGGTGQDTMFTAFVDPFDCNFDARMHRYMQCGSSEDSSSPTPLSD